MINAKIIADSVSPRGVRLTTFEVEFHRFVLPELNTHRVFSRNYQSSRAVPVEKMIEQVRNDPAMPVHWGSNQPGMQAGGELTGDDLTIVKGAWRSAARSAADAASVMLAQGLHKQVANRVLEPFVWTRGVITAVNAGYDGFFALRCHKMAQPEINVLAETMRKECEGSAPRGLAPGMWHTPYYLDGYWHPDSQLSLDEAIKISISCAAQVSYRTLDDSLEKANRIYERLNLPANGVWPDDPPHFSPAEHCALCLDDEVANYNDEADMNDSDIGGNFQTLDWFQYRKMLELGVELDYIS